MKRRSMTLMMWLRRGDHGTVIGSHQAEILAFFARHSR